MEGIFVLYLRDARGKLLQSGRPVALLRWFDVIIGLFLLATWNDTRRLGIVTFVRGCSREAFFYFGLFDGAERSLWVR